METKINDLGRFRRAIDHALQRGSVMGVEVPPCLIPGNKLLGDLTKGELEHIASELKNTVFLFGFIFRFSFFFRRIRVHEECRTIFIILK
jgi:hypothetical protein